MIPILDTHLHLLNHDLFHYDWCSNLDTFNRDFSIDSYQELILGNEVTASIFMEVDVRESQINKEAAFFSAIANKSENSLISVIAACRPEQQNFKLQLESLLNESNTICGLRRVLHNQPDEISQSQCFRNNLQSLPEYDLTFDLCVLERQLSIAYELVKSCPETKFILNHCGIPTISSTYFNQWKKDIQKLAELPNVACKISGIIAYCTNQKEATLDTLKPWIETSLESFGSNRIVLGSDWPVCNLTKDLPSWLNMVRDYFSSYTQAEQNSIFHSNAETIYNVSL